MAQKFGLHRIALTTGEEHPGEGTGLKRGRNEHSGWPGREERKRAREARELPLLSLYYINKERERRRGPGGVREGGSPPGEGEGSKEAGMDIPGGVAGRSGSERPARSENEYKF